MTTQTTLTIREIINRLDTPEHICYGDDHLLRECNIDDNWVSVPENTLTRKPIDAWTCTDTEVGLFAIYLKGEFVCLSFQEARKSYPKYVWASKDAYDKTRQFLLSLLDEKKEEEDFKILNMDIELPAYREREWLSQLDRNEDSEAFYEDQFVKVLISETRNGLREQNGYIDHIYTKVLVELNGDRKEVDITDLRFPIKLRN